MKKFYFYPLFDKLADYYCLAVAATAIVGFILGFGALFIALLWGK